MNIIILGENNFNNNYIFEYLKNHHNVTFSTIDFTYIHYNSFNHLFISNKIDIIINLINYNGKCKYKKYKLNSVLPIILSNFCINNNSKYIQVSSGEIFKNCKEDRITEFTLPKSNDDYLLSKILGEFSSGTIIRTNIYKKNSTNTNCLTILELSKVLLKIINNNLFWDGIRNIHSPDETTNSLQSITNINQKLDILPLQDQLAEFLI